MLNNHYPWGAFQGQWKQKRETNNATEGNTVKTPNRQDADQLGVNNVTEELNSRLRKTHGQNGT